MASDPTQPSGPSPDGYRPGMGRQPDLLGDEEDADIPPPPLGAATDPLDEDAQDRLRRMHRRGRMLPGLLVAVALGAFVAIVWWAYRTANTDGTPTDVPVVQAEPGEEKVRPESEGGMEIPDQDKQIYEQLGSAEGEPEVERLMPPPEEPLAPPAPPPPPAEASPDTGDLTPPPAPQEVVPAPAEEGVATSEAAPDAAAEPPAAPGATAEVPAPAETAPAADAPAVTEPIVEAPAPEPEPEPEAAPAPEPEAAPQVAAAGDGFRVQLASVKSEADANAEWAKLQKAHADLLGGLSPTIQRADLGSQGVFYRIQGGPLVSRDAAAALCEALKAKNQDCLVVKP